MAWLSRASQFTQCSLFFYHSKVSSALTIVLSDGDVQGGWSVSQQYALYKLLADNRQIYSQCSGDVALTYISWYSYRIEQVFRIIAGSVHFSLQEQREAGTASVSVEKLGR